MTNIKIRLEEGAEMPIYQSAGCSGVDVKALKILKAYKGKEEVVGDKLAKMQRGFENWGINLRAYERILFGTGIYAEIPPDMELQVRSRSGCTLKKGLVVMNQPGTIDADYRGEIGIILYNGCPFLSEVKKGERIAQLVLAKVEKGIFEQVSEEEFNSDTERGEGGFGHTGTK